MITRFFRFLWQLLRGWLFGKHQVALEHSAVQQKDAISSAASSAKPEAVSVHSAPPMTYQEAHDRSWAFLYKIVDYVQKKFSKPDLGQVVTHGKTMFQAGVVYVHQVVFNPEQQSELGKGTADKTPVVPQKKTDGR